MNANNYQISNESFLLDHINDKITSHINNILWI